MESGENPGKPCKYGRLLKRKPIRRKSGGCGEKQAGINNPQIIPGLNSGMFRKCGISRGRSKENLQTGFPRIVSGKPRRWKKRSPVFAKKNKRLYYSRHTLQSIPDWRVRLCLFAHKMRCAPSAMWGCGSRPGRFSFLPFPLSDQRKGDGVRDSAETLELFMILLFYETRTFFSPPHLTIPCQVAYTKCNRTLLEGGPAVWMPEIKPC